jgi:hypothetical protein
MAFLTVIITTAAVFLCLRLDGIVHWNLQLIFTPIYIFEAIDFLTVVYNEETATVLKTIFWKAVRVAFLVLLAFHYDAGSPGWKVVVIPLWVGAVVMVMSLLMGYLHYSKVSKVENEHRFDATWTPTGSRYALFLFKVMAAVELSLVVSLFFFTLHVTGNGVSAMGVGIPFFVGLGLAIMIMSCALCFGGASMVQVDEEDVDIESGRAGDDNTGGGYGSTGTYTGTYADTNV